MAITKKLYGCQPNSSGSYTKSYQTHEDCGYGYKVVCRYNDEYTKPMQVYRGINAVYKFMEKMLYEVNYCKKVMRNNFNKPLKMTNEDEQHFKETDKGQTIIFLLEGGGGGGCYHFWDLQTIIFKE